MTQDPGRPAAGGPPARYLERAPWPCSVIIVLILAGAMLHVRTQALVALSVLLLSLVAIVMTLRAACDR